jgi:hypothetical protein
LSYDEAFVGVLAIVIAVIAAVIAVGPWSQPYDLRTMSLITRRYGKPVARGLWVAIAVALLSAGSAILSGLRPSYADPVQRAQLDR